MNMGEIQFQWIWSSLAMSCRGIPVWSEAFPSANSSQVAVSLACAASDARISALTEASIDAAEACDPGESI